jgi:beta-glucosidase
LVANTGKRDGADVVQVYAQLPDPGAPERLVGFARVEVTAGETTDFAIAVPFSTLATWDGKGHRWNAPSGAYTLSVGHWAQTEALAYRAFVGQQRGLRRG